MSELSEAELALLGRVASGDVGFSRGRYFLLQAGQPKVPAEFHTLRARGLVHGDASAQQVVEALHRFLTWTPAKLLGVSLADAVGDRRTVNQPGTHQEYPNWRVALSDASGRPLLLEDVVRSRRARSLARAVRRR